MFDLRGRHKGYTTENGMVFDPHPYGEQLFMENFGFKCQQSTSRDFIGEIARRIRKIIHFNYIHLDKPNPFRVMYKRNCFKNAMIF